MTIRQHKNFPEIEWMIKWKCRDWWWGINVSGYDNGFKFRHSHANAALLSPLTSGASVECVRDHENNYHLQGRKLLIICLAIFNEKIKAKILAPKPWREREQLLMYLNALNHNEIIMFHFATFFHRVKKSMNKSLRLWLWLHYKIHFYASRFTHWKEIKTKCWNR